jgi:putative oxidoreductase
MKDWIAVPLRLAIGAIFIAHGLQKAFGLFGGPGIHGFTQGLTNLGFVPAALWAYLATSIELLGGIFVLLGIYTRVASAFIGLLIIIATIKVHLAKGFFLSNGGFEYNLLILCACVALVLSGPGKWGVTKK